jgi:hypothetical protein
VRADLERAGIGEDKEGPLIRHYDRTLFVRKDEDREVAARRKQIRITGRKSDRALGLVQPAPQSVMRDCDPLSVDHHYHVFVTGVGRPTRMKNRANA